MDDIRWPDIEEQAICAAFLQDYPIIGYSLCYLFGAYRAAGHAREEAARLARQSIANPGEEWHG